jgi:hypothetical protein
MLHELGGIKLVTQLNLDNSSVCPSVRPSVRPSVHPSVRRSVHTCRLGIQRKMAQAQQIRSIILQNHESTT